MAFLISGWKLLTKVQLHYKRPILRETSLVGVRINPWCPKLTPKRRNIKGSGLFLTLPTYTRAELHVLTLCQTYYRERLARTLISGIEIRKSYPRWWRLTLLHICGEHFFQKWFLQFESVSIHSFYYLA